MRTVLKKTVAIALAATLGFLASGVETTVSAATETSETTAETTAVGKDFLKNVVGEYLPLFEGATFDSKYDHYWHDFTAAVIGDSMADYGVSVMKKAIGASTYGAAAGDDFFCGFTEDVSGITFGGADGTEVTFTKKDGTTIKHTYTYVKDATATGSTDEGAMEMGGYLYKSKDDNTDEFTYIFMCPDTPATTYHLEFRYGDTEENILQLTDGKYKNWLAAGLSASALSDPTEDIIQKVIGLFVVENVASMANEETKAQRVPITGVWDMDTTAFKSMPGYEKAELYITLEKNGTGKSYMDMQGTKDYQFVSEYPFYIYDTDKNDGKDAGIYLVVSEDEGIKTAAYSIENKDGKRILTFTSNEGELTYIYRGAIAPAKVSLSKVKKNGTKALKISWKKVADADGYVVLVSTNKSFKNAKKVTVKGKTSTTVKKLKKGKKYYVKVRAYVTNALGKKTYGKYSAVKAAKTK